MRVDCISIFNTIQLYNNQYCWRKFQYCDRKTRAKNIGPDQPSLIRDYTVCHPICLYWTHHWIVKPNCSFCLCFFIYSSFLFQISFLSFQPYRSAGITRRTKTEPTLEFLPALCPLNRLLMHIAADMSMHSSAASFGTCK